MPEYLTVPEIAARWHVPARAVYHAIWKGALPALRVGRSLRISKTAADEWAR